MNQIGNDFKYTRINSSLSIEEVSQDTNIPLIALEQIEEGNIGAFKDIFELKSYLQTYAKYLGLDEKNIIDEFNEYMFEYTSKIPLDELQKAIIENNKESEEILEETKELKAVSPYLISQRRNDNTKIIFILVLIIILVSITLIWVVKEVL